MVVDEVLSFDKPELGASLNGHRVGGIAYADDLILFTENEARMCEELVAIRSALASTGMSVNCLKSRCLTLKGFRKRKTSVLEEVEYVLDGVKVSSVCPMDSFEYLGLLFDWKRVLRSPCKRRLAGMIDEVTKVPQKPQQRVTILREFLLPKLGHSLDLCNIHGKSLRQMDKSVRMDLLRVFLHHRA